jgi:Zn-dependent M28 family amino/carboxypeptidase
LFGGEEQGLIGSTSYVNDHLGDLPNCTAVLISDAGSDAPRGWFLFGREDVKNALRPIEPLLSGLGADNTADGSDAIFGSDQAAFAIHGIPTLVLWNASSEPTVNHKPGDTFDKVNKHTLAEGVAVLAATAYAVADSTSFAVHIPESKVEEWLRRQRVYEDYLDLKIHGVF